MQVGDLGGHGAARIDHHHLHRGPRLLRRREALVQHRVAPGEVRADQHDEIGQFEILVVAGHRVGAECAAVAGDRGCHAEARVGVDVGRTDETLHQLVGDVIVLGQQLARDIEGDRIRTVLGDGPGEASRQRGRAPRPSRRAARQFRDEAAGRRDRRSRQAPTPLSRAGRNSPDGRDRRGRRRFRPRAILASTPHPTPQ